MTITQPVTAEQMTASRWGVARTAWITTLAAVATNLSVFGLARAVGIEFATEGSARTITVGPGAVAATTLVTMIVGWVAVVLATRRHRPTLRTMAIIGGVFAALSTVTALTLNVDSSAKLALASLHLVPGAFYVVGVSKLVRADIGATR